MHELTPINHPDARYAASVVAALEKGQDIGITYGSVVLSSRESGVIDAYNTSIASLMRYATLYWPGGNPDHGRKVETIVQGDITADGASAEAEIVERLILGAQIGVAALRRVPASLREMWATVESNVPGAAVSGFKERAAHIKRPFGLCTISDVTNGDPGRRIMHFFHPYVVDARTSLDEFKRAVRFDTPS